MRRNPLLTLLGSDPSPHGPTSSSVPPYSRWCEEVSPSWRWDWPHLKYVRSHLADVTLGNCQKLGIAWPPQHGKSEGVTVRYPLWRMLREPGTRAGIACHTQRYANKLSRKMLRIARSLNLKFGDAGAVDEWNLANGSSFIARGAGAGFSGEPLDCLVIDDPFRHRKDADSVTVQERVYEWYMDDVTPRIQKNGSLIIIHTRWNPGDLLGRIFDSEEAAQWKYVILKAIAEENDPLGRQPGEPLCEDRFPLAKLLEKRAVEGVGFESLYQQNPIPRGGTFFERRWFKVLDALPTPPPDAQLVRYWDLAASRKDSACYTAGVLVAMFGRGAEARFYVLDVVRGRWAPAERNEVILQTAEADRKRPGFQRTYFEEPVFDTGREAGKAIVAKLAGHRVQSDNVSGSKAVRAEPYADAARGGLVCLVAGPWVGAYLTELEGFPKGQWKDQVDSSSGCFNRLTARKPVAAVWA